MTNKTVVPCCYYIFCSECIIKNNIINNNNCPMCRNTINNNNLTHYTVKNNCNQEKYKNKMDTLLSIISTCSTKKTILYSSYSDTNDYIEPILTNNNIKYSILKGNQTIRSSILNKYNSQNNNDNNNNLLLLNDIYNGIGTNLCITENLILFNGTSKINDTIKNNEQIIRQIINLNNNKVLNIYNLIPNI